MNALAHGALHLRDRQPDPAEMHADVLRGLGAKPRRLPSKYFYDARGSRLFESICAQPEYYLTRAELEIMRGHVGEIAQALGPDALLLEYGSGSGLKTRLLLRHLRTPVAYVPVEIAPEALSTSVMELAAEFPHVEMLPVCADFTRTIELPRPRRPARRTVLYFPGSTLGNFETPEALRLLRQMRAEMGHNGAALVGIDLRKDRATLEAAYNDAAGVTAEFTLNMLARFNRELDADFRLADFRHRARWNALAGRIETHVVSTRAQTVHVAGQTFIFEAGEAMLVEYSCKYTLEEFAALAERAGLRVTRTWEDSLRRFSVQLLEPAGS